jgi:predicted Ser/Thr protein kinase
VSARLGPGSSFGRYRIESELGRGGMSVVYLAEDPSLSRRVAIKVLAPELAADAAFRSRFIRESQLAAGLDHPNIVPVHEAGEVDGDLFIAMRYVRGTDLRTLIEREGALEPERVAALLHPIASALDAAHRAGLVHRDVKPANILVALDQDEEHPYLADFGLTKATTSKSGLTKTGTFMGTVDYVAPEQIQGDEVDGRTDEYSLACVMYQCLTATPPFEKGTDVATLFGHLQDPPPAVSDRRTGLPPEIDRVVARGMAKSKQDRYPRCVAMMDAFGQAIGISAPARDAAAAPTAFAPPPGAPLPLPPPTGGQAVTETGSEQPTPGHAETVLPEAPASPGPTGPSEAPPEGNRRRRIVIIGGVAAAAVLAVIVAAVSLGGSDTPTGPTVAAADTGAGSVTGPTATGPTSTPENPFPVFSSSDPITLPGAGDPGLAEPYPSGIEVSGVDGTIADINVTLNGLTQVTPEDVAILLVGPQPDRPGAILMQGVGGDRPLDVGFVTFDDESLEVITDPLVEGTFAPTAVDPEGFQDGSAKAPSPDHFIPLSGFNGEDPNGTWELFLLDPSSGRRSQISLGWTITFEIDTG